MFSFKLSCLMFSFKLFLFNVLQRQKVPLACLGRKRAMFLCFGRRSDVLHIEYSARTVEHSDNGNDEDSIILHYRRYRISKRLISAMLDVIRVLGSEILQPMLFRDRRDVSRDKGARGRMRGRTRRESVEFDLLKWLKWLIGIPVSRVLEFRSLAELMR